MTKQIVTSSESGACGSTNTEQGVESFERLLRGFQSQLVGFKTEDTVLIGNCPQNVTDEEINKFFCGFATIVKLQRVVYKSLTTNVYIAKFESTESASRSKVLNTLTLNGKKILLLQPDEKHIFSRKNVVELNGLQEHSEEVIYDHMSTFGNVSFVLKTNTVTYIVFEELSAVESSCRCDYLDQYPVTIRSVLDSAGAGGPGSSIENCILEQIDQNTSLLADEDEGQINNFMEMLDMENLDEYLEQDEKDKSSTSDKPLLEVGNEEIIVTEDEAVHSEGEKEADVAAIEKEALQQTQSQRKKTTGTVLVDNRTQTMLKLSGSSLNLSDLPQLNVAVRRVPNKVKIGPKKGALRSKHEESKKKKKKKSSATAESSAGKIDLEASVEHKKKQKESDLKAKVKDPTVEKKKTSKEMFSGKEESKGAEKSDRDKTNKKHTKKHAPIVEQGENKTAESVIDKSKGESIPKASEIVSSDKKKENEHEVNANTEEHRHIKDKKQTEIKKVHKSEQIEASSSKLGVSESTSATTEAGKEIKVTLHDKSEAFLQTKKTVFVQLTKLTSKQIQALSQVRRETVTSHSVVDGDVAEKKIAKKRKPGPAKGALKEKHAVGQKQDVKKKTKVVEKYGLSDDEMKPSEASVTKSISKEPVGTDYMQREKKKPKLDESPKKAEQFTQQEQVEPSVGGDDYTTLEESTSQIESKVEISSDQKCEIQESNVTELNVTLQTSVDEPTVSLESTPETAPSKFQEKIIEPVLDVSNTVEISQAEPVHEMESDEEQPLVMDITFDTTEDLIGNPSVEEKNFDRKAVLLDSRSAALLKGKIHDGHSLFIDVLPRVVVKIRHITASDYNITRPKEHSKPSSGHHEKQSSKKVSFDSSAVKRKEDKPDKPRKTNLDRIDIKFLPAGSKLKSKLKSKTEINHKKHLPVPELPIELKTHLNTSFKIPKKDSSVTPQSIDRNASELNCLHKEQDEREKHRKRFQKERRPRDGPGGRDRNQHRPQVPEVRQEREPSPVPDFFDPSFDDNHSPSPQRIPPTPPPASAPTIITNSQTAQKDANLRAAPKNSENNKPTFQEIWNIPEKKPDVWTNPPWASSATGSSTIDSGKTWDSEPRKPHRDRNMNTRPIKNNQGLATRALQPRNTIDSGESWSPGGAAPQKKSEQEQQSSQTIGDGESWSPGINKPGQQRQGDVKQERQPPPQFSARRSRSPHQVQLSNTIASGDMWDINPSANARKPSPKRNLHRNPLLCGPAWDDDDDMLDKPTETVQRDRRLSVEQRPVKRVSPVPNREQRRRSRSPFRQRRSRSRSPDRRRRSRDRSPLMHNRSENQSPNRRNAGRSRDQRGQPTGQRQQHLDRHANRTLDRKDQARGRSPFGRQRHSRSRSPVRLQGNFDRSFRSRRSCSPRPGLTLSPSDMWDAGASSRRQIPQNPLLGGATWDEEIVPLTNRSPPRLQESLLDDHRQYALDRFPPNSRIRSNSRDRMLLEREHQWSPSREVGNRRWSRDRSPNRRKRSHSRSPDGWHRSMERSPVGRRRSIGDNSSSYQEMLDYWKAVEDREEELDSSSGRLNMQRRNEFGQSQLSERWESRERGRDSLDRSITGRMDIDSPCANQPQPRHPIIDDSQYSPSGAFDAVSSEDECDFTNPRRPINKTGRKAFEAVPLELPSRSQAPAIQLGQLPATATLQSADHEASRDSLDSVPSFKEDDFSEASCPQTQWNNDDKKNVLEHLKQRAERLKKLEEMKLARQKLLAQIKQKPPTSSPQPSEEEMNKPSMSMGQIDNDERAQDQAVLAAAAVISTAKDPVSNIDASVNKPFVPAIPPPLPPIQTLPIFPLLPFSIIPPVPPFPSGAPPMPPPEQPPPPEPVNFLHSMVPPPSNAWNPSPPMHAPIAHIDVSKPPPNLANPLLNAMSSTQYDSPKEESIDDRPNSFEDNHTINPCVATSKFMDDTPRSQPTREHKFNMPSEDNSLRRMPSHEIDTINTGMRAFSEPNNQREHDDPRQFEQRFGDNRQLIRPQQRQQRDPRQSHDDNAQRGQFNINRSNNINNNNPRNNFNRENPGNFDCDTGNNFDNNLQNNFRNNNPGNNFNNDGSGINFDFNDQGNDFDFDGPDNNFNNNNPRNNFNNNRENFVKNNKSGNNFNNPGVNFNNNNPRNNNPRNNFNNNPRNNFSNNNNPRNNFNNNNRRNTFNMDDSGNNFNNNNPRNDFSNNTGNNSSGHNFNNNPGINFECEDPGNDFDFEGPRNSFNNNPRNNFNNNLGGNFNNNNPGNNFNNNPGNNFNNNNPGNNFNNNNPGNNFNNNNLGNFLRNNRGGRGGGGRGRFSNIQQQQRFNFQQQNRNQRFGNNNNNNNNRNNQHQQQRYLMQEQEMFDESCFDMNEVNPIDGDNANDWDDLI